MLKIDYLNVDQICSVKSYINIVDRSYIFKKGIKFLGITIRKEGFYYRYGLVEYQYISNEDIETDGTRICTDTEVIYAPHLDIKMSNGTTYSKYFKNKEMLFAFMDSDQMKNINWINA